MSVAANWVLSFALNALWQIPLVFLMGLLLSRLVRRLGPAAVHRAWVGTLLLEVFLPAISIVREGQLDALLRYLPWGAHHGGAGDQPRIWVVAGAGYAHGTIGLPHTVLLCLAILYATCTGFSLARLFRCYLQTRDLRRGARSHKGTAETEARWQRYRRLFAVLDAELAVSPSICGPVTVGVFRPAMLLPETFEMALAEDMDAAVAHEFAHMRRRDFGKNLLYRLLAVPISFHPLLRPTTAHLGETREMVCDALAAEAVAGPQRYARSLLRLASSFAAGPRTGNLHAIGIFDANTLERRLMHLTTERKKLTLAQRLAIGAVSAVIALGACTSAIALRMGVSTPLLQATGTSGKAVHIAGGVMAGNTATRVNPVYPQEARDAKISGSVVLHAVIGKDGSVQNLSVISGPPELTGSAIDAVRQWTYKPYILNGDPTEVETTITVNYQLAE